MKKILVSACGVVAACVMGFGVFEVRCSSMAANLYELQCAAKGEITFDDMTASQAAIEFEEAYVSLVADHGNMVVREVLAKVAGLQKEAEEKEQLESSARTEAKRRIGVEEKDPFAEYNKIIKTEIKPILYKYE